MTLFWRITFFLAVLGNLLFFAWSQGYFGRLEDGREPQRLVHQIEPEKLRITDVPPPPSPSEKICRLIGGANGLPMAEVQRLQAALTAESTPFLRLGIHTMETSIRHWVFIPPLASKGLVDKKIQELRQLGVKEAKPMLTDNTDHLAISLGLYATAEAAQAQLATLKQRGVRTAVIQARPHATETARVDVHATREDLQKRLPELLNAAGLVDVPLTDCPDET